ncbi:anti-sigma regulatory factor (Ser/Thr protein kinase) [Actinophytocola oryzae]|uniref:Anti-sigma regulatory factor (Ser/Thr protein kinase) n=1 Tax=Actinophytocola oryzae TaxID=502181 RepID=A0A4R7VFD9_9PSEU|nr:anti-sigma regulatory factor (Ser/Thr protein kinase) [Actinophytocola oryzae]
MSDPGDHPHGVVRELRHSVDANPDTIGRTRDLLGEWASAAGVVAEQRDDLLLATYEAMANSTEHAYGGHGGVIDLHAYRTPDGIAITVSDHGNWRAPHPSMLRGRGLPLIEGLADHAEITHDEFGTTVRMRWDLVGPDAQREDEPQHREQRGDHHRGDGRDGGTRDDLEQQQHGRGHGDGQ